MTTFAEEVYEIIKKYGEIGYADILALNEVLSEQSHLL